jgi:hypothetical protein
MLPICNFIRVRQSDECASVRSIRAVVGELQLQTHVFAPQQGDDGL